MLTTEELLEKMAVEWALKVNGHMCEGFATKPIALDYYRNSILPTEPQSVSLWAKSPSGKWMFDYIII